MVGDVVAVVWNLSHETERAVAADGSVVETTFSSRQGSPYIDFVSIREVRGKSYENDDSPLDGGFSAEQASRVADELVRAVLYLKEIQ